MPRTAWTLENRSQLPASITTILVPVDFTAASTAAMGHAVAIARAHGAAIDAVHVYDVPSYTGAALVFEANEGGRSSASPTFAQFTHDRATSQLESFLASWNDETIDIRGRVLDGEPARVLVALIRDEHFDLCVIGERDKSAREILLGSVADAVLREADCPVVTVRPVPEPREPAVTPEDAPRAR
jgi:nucleotide-binding universal stress UspA family protein